MGTKAAASLANLTIAPAGNQCTNVARTISVDVTPGGAATNTVVLNYSLNGVAQTAIQMTNTTNTLATDTWTGTIPTVSPANANVTWSVTATDTSTLFKTQTGTAYKDEPLIGITATAEASVNTICLGNSSVLSLGGSASAPTYATPPAVTNATSDEDLGNITITQGGTIILNNSTLRNSLVGSIGTATGTDGGYSNFTSFGPYGLNPGQTYDFSVSSLQGATAYGNAMAIYIDYNRNGVFTDSGELVYTSPATVSGAHTRTGSFLVPANANTRVCTQKDL